MRARLIILLLFPLTVLTFSLGIVAQDRWTETEAAADVVERVDDLRSLIALQSALYDERASVELEARSNAFGVPSTLGAGLLGVPPSVDTHAATDQALVAAASAPPNTAALIEAARAEHDSGSVDAVRAYESVDAILVERLFFEVDAMKRIGVATADAGLADSLEQLEASVRLFSASIGQTTGLANAWFGNDEAARDEALSQLGIDSTRYSLALAAIDVAQLPSEVGAELEPSSDPISVAAAELVAGRLDRPDAGDLSNLDLIIDVFRTSFNRNGILKDLVATLTSEVEAAAGSLAADAAGSFNAVLIVGGFAVATSFLLSGFLARGIATPMGAVARRTRDLQAGRIETSPLALTGPRELRDVAGAINDVSDNLGALEIKLDALARADLDDPALHEPLPGRLGETISKSVDTLSQSISDRRDLQARLAHQATHDALTGLLNRAAILTELDQVLGQADECGAGLLFVDLDDFKRANDVFGHGVGDAVLVEIADRLRAACRPQDAVARLGGDEFLIVTSGVADLEGLRRHGERIVSAVRQPMHVPGTGGLQASASVGAAITNDPEVVALDLLAEADAALYVAKASDDRVAVFDDELRERLGNKSSIEQRLREALTNGELEVHYQPVVSSGSLEVDQMEALVRWPGEDSCGPDVFIPVAEASDLVIDIDRFVLHRATAELARLQVEGRAPHLSVAVNISGRHLLNAGVADHVAEALDASGLAPSCLIIEVTETALIADLDRAALHLEALRRVGVRVSVDDFGTGFTSISQLRRLPIDELKIDRSIIMELPGDQTLIRVVRDLAEHFGLDTVAEGVETQLQADFLRQLGCTQLQGWLYARAMSADDLRRWIDAGGTRPTAGSVAAPDSP